MQCYSGSLSQSPVCTRWTTSPRKSGLTLKGIWLGFFSLYLKHTRERFALAGDVRGNRSREGNAPAIIEQAPHSNNRPLPGLDTAASCKPSGMFPSRPDKPTAHVAHWGAMRGQPSPLLPSQKHPSSLPYPAQINRGM